MDYKEIAVISCEIFSCVKIAAVISYYDIWAGDILSDICSRKERAIIICDIYVVSVDYEEQATTW